MMTLRGSLSWRFIAPRAMTVMRLMLVMGLFIAVLPALPALAQAAEDARGPYARADALEAQGRAALTAQRWEDCAAAFARAASVYAETAQGLAGADAAEGRANSGAMKRDADICVEFGLRAAKGQPATAAQASHRMARIIRSEETYPTDLARKSYQKAQAGLESGDFEACADHFDTAAFYYRMALELNDDAEARQNVADMRSQGMQCQAAQNGQTGQDVPALQPKDTSLQEADALYARALHATQSGDHAASTRLLTETQKRYQALLPEVSAEERSLIESRLADIAALLKAP